MFPNQDRTTVRWFVLVAAGALLLLASGSAAGAQDTPAKPAPPEKQATASAQEPAAPMGQPGPAQTKPVSKKVYDNDNLPRAGGAGVGGVNFSDINNCDRNCFEQIRQLARVNPAANPNWKREVLQAVDTVRKEGEWRQYLRDLHNMYLRFCEIGEEKKEELAGVADPKNVTPRELTVDEKYDKKFKEAQVAVEAIYARQRGIQQKFASNPFSMTFSNIQVSRIQRMQCNQQRYQTVDPSDADDP